MYRQGWALPRLAESHLRGCCAMQIDESYADVRVVGGREHGGRAAAHGGPGAL